MFGNRGDGRRNPPVTLEKEKVYLYLVEGFCSLAKEPVTGALNLSASWNKPDRFCSHRQQP